MNISRRTLYITLLIVINIAVDQISKFIVRAQVIPHKETKLLGDYFVLTNVENSGAFLGMGSNFNPTLKFILLLALPIAVLGYVTFYVIKNKKLDKFSLIGFCLIIGGGIANVYDRIAYGSVTDFFHIDFGGIFKTGIFNLADLSVTTGMIMLLVSTIFHKEKHKG